MKKSKFLKVFSSAMALSLVLTACSSGTSTKKSSGAKPAVEFKTSVDNGGTAVNTPLKVGILSNAPLIGMYNPAFALNATDLYVTAAFTGDTFKSDDLKRFKQDDDSGAVKLHLDKDAKTATLTINKDLTWSNGQPVTAKDIVATYELMGNKDYVENIRYEDTFDLIEGMKDYHEGKADKISGITVKDDKTVVIKYTKLSPALLWGSGFISSFLNAEQVAEASKDFTKFVEAELNTKPLSYGPYVIDQVVAGESVSLKANEHYFKKSEVKTKNIEFKRVVPAQASQVMKAGEVDLMGDLTADIWSNTKDLQNGTILGQPDYYMSYVGFKLGKFDKEKGEVVVNPDAKAADVRVREAFGYAVDWDQINAKLYQGLRFTPTGSGLYPPIVKFLYNPENPGYKLDQERAKKLLDEAGLKDVDGDGLREDKNGKKLTFNFAIRDVGQTFDQALADTFLKSWKDVGLDVKLVDGKLMAPNEWSQRVQADDPEIDLFQGAWGLGTDPNPTQLLGNKSPLNFQRYTDDNLKASLEKINSPEMFDDNKLKEVYQKFDKDFAETRAWLPFSWNTAMLWVNKRVKSFDLVKAGKGELGYENLELTADKGAQG
ncbi:MULTISPECIES: ABC transporter substrate-binding protein [unclassified Gemella]|uniref:ABC transporter substrate-binding protein n=1 Tax=unclassified Gemella TaxID=2624949 RepID=UPI001C03CC67|nr:MULTISPECIES: ABC transporter substrate-binding protein [unclassified Gemella]MBU0278182.1 peptide ABC transporter substrate-binding protein [Gemella sp. zg-1178]QWQ38860.1 peptide ABC transporter substrate-binding protein [Gemella sp. zg-570]